MIANKLPSVLYQPNGNSLSVERVLKQALMLLEEATPSDTLIDQTDVCLEDLTALLQCINRD